MADSATGEIGKSEEISNMAPDSVIAKPSGVCCLKGTIHEGQPRGSTTTVAGVETYIVEPPPDRANGHILLYFPDVWGFFNNGFLIMDGFADAGYLTLGLDYFRGDPVWKHRKDRNDTTTEPGFDYEAWKKKHMAFSDEAVPRWVDEVKLKYGKSETRYACVGYCYGAPYVCDQLSSNGICSAGGFAHPAFLKESHFYNLNSKSASCEIPGSMLTPPSDPLFLSCAEIDHTFPNEFRNRAVDIMQAEKKVFQVQLFQGVEHGFALRGNPDDVYERYTKEQSLKAMAEWFDLWLAKDVGRQSTKL